MVPPFCTFSLHLAALRDLAFLSAASVFKHQLKYDGGHFYTIYSLLLHHHAAGGAWPSPPSAPSILLPPSILYTSSYHLADASSLRGGGPLGSLELSISI